MTISAIEQYLSRKNNSLAETIGKDIELVKKSAIKDSNEELANYCWCLNSIFQIQKSYVSTFIKLKNGEYADAWLDLEQIEISLSALSENFELDKDDDKYHLILIDRLVKGFQKIYPYEFFFSRESIIKSEKCSICGKKVSLRNPCGHRKGKLYMGEQCVHIITDIDLKAIAIVEDPFDKYARLEIPEKEYDYGMLELLLSELNNPYDEFMIEDKMVKRPEYRNVGRNELCPCGSGVKYKKCHMGTKGELMVHHIIHLSRPFSSNNKGVRYFGTWKN